MSIRSAIAGFMLSASALVFLSAACPKTPQTEGFTDADFSDSERWLFRMLFKIRVGRWDDSGLAPKLIPGILPWQSRPAGSDEQVFLRYMESIGVSHLALMKEDKTYAKHFSEFEADVISRLGLRASFTEGTRFVYAEGVRRGIYAAIMRKAGRSPISTVPPPFSEYDEEAARGMPFASGSDFLLAPSDAPASVMPFHYCSGTGGITISGGDQDPYVRAHEWLRRHDREYARAFDDVIAPFVERAEKVDRFDFEATSAITHDLRRAMVDAGLADEIQRRADRGDSNSGKQEATGESQEGEN